MKNANSGMHTIHGGDKLIGPVMGRNARTARRSDTQATMDRGKKITASGNIS